MSQVNSPLTDLISNPQMVTANTTVPFSSSGQPKPNLMGRLMSGAKSLYGLASANPTAMLGGALGLLGGARNRQMQGTNIDFDYGMERSEYNPNNQMSTAMSQMGSLGQEFSDSYRQMLNPGSAYNNRLFQNLRQNIGDQSQQTINNMNSQLASRGITGMSGVYDAINNRAGGEAYSQGMQNIMNQSANQASRFGQLAGSMYNQAGQLAGLQDARTLQNNQFNAANQIEYGRNLVNQQYDQAVNNANLQNSIVSQEGSGLLGLAGNVLGSLFT